MLVNATEGDGWNRGKSVQSKHRTAYYSLLAACILASGSIVDGHASMCNVQHEVVSWTVIRTGTRRVRRVEESLVLQGIERTLQVQPPQQLIWLHTSPLYTLEARPCV